MQFEFKLQPPAPEQTSQTLQVGARQIPVMLVRNMRARRYVLRLRPDGVARVTVPRRGSIADAWEFAQKHTGWLERQFERLAAAPVRPKEWTIGTQIYYRGQLVPIDQHSLGLLRFGDQIILEEESGLRRIIECQLRRLAHCEFPPRVMELAALHKLPVRRVMVRNQRSRWGSCSRRGTISLNWRLIQTPEFVRDYIILHELMHLRQMNHSARFWREVESVCPDFENAESWLKKHSGLLR